jgi:hypothetical protein
LNPIHRPRDIRLDFEALWKKRSEIFRRHDRISFAGAAQPIGNIVLQWGGPETLKVNATKPKLRLCIFGLGRFRIPTNRIGQASAYPFAKMVAFGETTLRFHVTDCGGLAKAGNRLSNFFFLNVFEPSAKNLRRLATFEKT